MKKILCILICTTYLFGFSLGDLGNSFLSSQKNIQKESSLQETTVATGLKEALQVGVDYAIKELGKKNGYLNNQKVTIALPSELQSAQKIVRTLGGDKIVDDLISSMNQAASDAAPQTARTFTNAISNMSLDDAKKILASDDNAATEYFKQKTSSDLQRTISTIVQKSMEANSVARYYKAFNTFYNTYAKEYVQNQAISSFAQSFGLGGYIPDPDMDLDAYVTQKALDGLFIMIAEKEADIRNNSLARTTSILQKVFAK